jgi:superfamily I DNA/RNA helicase
MSNDLLNNLNKKQLQAATHENEPLLIVAGAGTEKK